MKEKRTGNTAAKSATDWKRLQSLNDKQIRKALAGDPEVKPTTANFWRHAKVMLPEPKQAITIRLDADLLSWLRKQKGYQTRINAVLRTYMEAARDVRR